MYSYYICIYIHFAQLISHGMCLPGAIIPLDRPLFICEHLNIHKREVYYRDTNSELIQSAVVVVLGCSRDVAAWFGPTYIGSGCASCNASDLKQPNVVSHECRLTKRAVQPFFERAMPTQLKMYYTGAGGTALIMPTPIFCLSGVANLNIV